MHRDPIADAHTLRRLIAATLSDGGMRTDTRYDPDRMAVLVLQRLDRAGWSISRTAEKEPPR